MVFVGKKIIETKTQIIPCLSDNSSRVAGCVLASCPRRLWGEQRVTKAKYIGLDPVAAVSPAFKQFYSSLKQRLKLAS